MPNVHKSEFQQLLEQAMSQTPDIVVVAERKGDKAKIELASAAGHPTCISNINDLKKFGNRLYG